MHQEPHEILAGSKAPARRCALLCVNHPARLPAPHQTPGVASQTAAALRSGSHRLGDRLRLALRGPEVHLAQFAVILQEEKGLVMGWTGKTPHNVSTILSTSWVHPEQMPRCCQSPTGQAEDPTGMWNRGRREGLTLELNFHKTLLSPVFLVFLYVLIFFLYL